MAAGRRPALPFAKALAGAGLREKPGQEKPQLILKKPVEYAFEKVFYRAAPAASPSF